MAKKKTRKAPSRTAPATTERGPEPEQATRDQPAPCVACGSTDLEVVKKLPSQIYSGRLPGGVRYTSVERRRVRCRSCGQHQMKVTRPFDPARWPADNAA